MFFQWVIRKVKMSELQELPKSSNTVWFVLIGLLLVIPTGLFVWNERGNWQPVVPSGNPNGKAKTYKEIMEIQARPRDAMEVIGVVRDGKAKAWSMESFIRPDKHVFNDSTFGPSGLAVTFCDIDDCVKVLTQSSGKPPNLDMGGTHTSRPGKMLVVANGKSYWQDTFQPLYPGGEAFPYAEVVHERMTWGEWKSRHADSELYHEPNQSSK